ncbi:MAG: tetratricopeptide repeat protein [Sphingobacteriales bacterium]|jgi:tetratricopeptide (TPR) repeat protein|nr:tetratricopeptide repeat protein [Sphingobacteriales bacterium]
MSSFEFENEDDPINVSELVAQYEQSIQGAQTPFFDQDDYEVIIEYYEDMGRFDNALEVAEQSLLQHPYSSILLLKKAQIYFELKQLDIALDTLDKAEIYDSTEIGIGLLRAEIFTFQSRYKEAVFILQELLEKADKEDLPDVYLQMCDVYEDWEKYYEVYNCLIECLRIEPNNEEALNRLNYCIEITDRYEESIPLHLRLIDLNPYNQFAWYNLACSYRGCDEYEKAIDAFEYVLAINDDADFVYQDIAELHFKKKNFTRSLEVIKEMCETFEADDEIFFLQGKCHEALGNMKMARYCYRKAVHDNPSLSEAYFRIGETYKQEGLWEQAYKSFQKANELEKEQYDFCLAMAEAALEIGETEVSIDACETAIDIFVKRYEAYYILSRIMADSGDLETARQILLKGTEVCKTTVELNFALAALAFLENKNKEGEVLLRELLQSNFTSHELLFDFSEKLKDNLQIHAIIAEYN